MAGAGHLELELDFRMKRNPEAQSGTASAHKKALGLYDLGRSVSHDHEPAPQFLGGVGAAGGMRVRKPSAVRREMIS